jgi:hypothetical protein
MALLAGWSAVARARRCVIAGRDMVKIAAVRSAAGTVTLRLGVGAAAAGGDTSTPYGHLGEATLRLLGIAGAALARLKARPVGAEAEAPPG